MRSVWNRTGVVVAAMLGLAAVPAIAQEMIPKNVRVVVAAADPADARVVGTLDNPGMYPSYLIGASTDAAERVELRDARKKDAKVAEVEIPAYGALSLEARGLHLRLINPKKPLRVGTKIDLQLENEAHVKTRVSVTVAAR